MTLICDGDNKLMRQDRPFHDWYRFVLSYPPHLVRHYIDDFGLGADDFLLDPFCGTGTTLVEAKLAGVPSWGIEANPFPALASNAKTDWQISPIELCDYAYSVVKIAGDLLDYDQDVGEFERVLIKGSIDRDALIKSLALRQAMRSGDIMRFFGKAFKYGYTALGAQLVRNIGNLRFGPEVSVVKSDGQKKDVFNLWARAIFAMANDLDEHLPSYRSDAFVYSNDARDTLRLWRSSYPMLPRVTAVITSPPYPNEKDYTRATRLESVILGYMSDRERVRSIKKNLVRSNSKGIYRDDRDGDLIASNQEVIELAGAIERQRFDLGKTSGFERNYHRVVTEYFGGMARHLESLRPILRPGARLAYVVGDQASYFQVHIKTGELLAGIAEGLGYQVDRIDLFRERHASKGKRKLREEIVVMTYGGITK